jgi:hypothetical protein
LALTNPASETDLTSARLASTAAGLVGIDATGATISLDVLLPTQLAKVKDLGSLQLFVSCPSRGLANANLGSVNFHGARLGIYRTVKFTVSDKVRRALKGATYKDLTFDLKLHAPAKASGAYLFDNMRLGSPATPPPAPAASIDLVAITSYSPAATTPGVANFPVGVVQVPQSFHVKLGSAGTGTATLALGYTNSSVVTCTYVGATGGTSYVLSSCTGGAQAGDLLGADFAQLTIVSGDPTAGPTKIRAQLAENPVGDVTGGNVIPPMPTFWGDTAASANQIATDYFNAVNAAPPSGGQRVQAPVGDFAKRSGDPTPFDATHGPPPSNDPDFHYEGHMNNGGNWDGYWHYDSYLVYDEHYNAFPVYGDPRSVPTPDPAGHRTIEFTSDLSVHAVLWGMDKILARMTAQIDTDSGPIGNAPVDTPASSSGSIAVYDIFGNQTSSDINPGNGGTMSLPSGPPHDEYNLPVPIEIWIFTIQIGAVADAGVTVAKVGSAPVFSNTSIAAQVSPSASIGAHVFGGIDLGVASGGVDARIALLSATLTLAAQASWAITTDPTICNTTLSYALSGNAALSSLGGEVDLVASFGVCPFCWSDSWTIYSWSSLAETKYSLFNSSGQVPAALPTGTCWQCQPINAYSCADSANSVYCNGYGQPQPSVPCTYGCEEDPSRSDYGSCKTSATLCIGHANMDVCNGDESDHCDEYENVATRTQCIGCGCANGTCIGGGAPSKAWYRDQDGDGHGAGTGVMSCGQPGPGWVDNNDDCDDTSPVASQRFPGNPEVCGDGIDNDCNYVCDDGCYVTVYASARPAMGNGDYLISTDENELTDNGYVPRFTFMTYQNYVSGVTTTWQILRCINKASYYHFITDDPSICTGGAVLEAQYGYPILDSVSSPGWGLILTEECSATCGDLGTLEWLDEVGDCPYQNLFCDNTPTGFSTPGLQFKLARATSVGQCWGQ